MIHPPVAVWQRADPLVAPTGVTAFRDGVNIDISWTHAGGGGATGFRVYRRSRSVGGSFGGYVFWRTVSPQSNTTTTDETADGELEYQYRVHAWTGSVESAGAESSVVGAVAPITWTGGYPADYAPDDRSITYSFALTSVPDNSGLQVYRRIGSSMAGNPIANGTKIYEGIIPSGATDLGGEDVTGYLIARARYGSPGSYRYGPWSVEKSAISRPRVPGAPTSVVLTATGATTADLTWAVGSPTNADGHDIHYRRRADSGSPWGSWTDTFNAPGVTSPYNFTTAIEGDEHQLRIRAYNTGGTSAWVESNVVCVAAAPAVPSITSVSTTGVSDPTSKLRVVYSAGAGLGVELRYRSIAGGGTWLTDQGPDTDGSPFDLTGLADGQTYDVQIRTTNACGVASAWTITTQGTTQTAVPAAPTITSVEPTGGLDDRLTVSWTIPTGATNYDVQRAPDSGGSPGSWATITTGETGSSYLDTGLTAATRYHYRVRANNAGGSGPYSSAASGVTLLDRPTGFDSTHDTDVCPSIAVDLSWSNTNAGGNARSETVTVQRSSNGGSSWTTITSSLTAGSTSYRDTGASTATNRYRVKYNSEGVWSEDPITIICPI